MFIGALYAVQFVPSVEYRKFGLFPPLFRKVKVEFALAVIDMQLFTFTTQVAVLPPSCVLTVIVAVPSYTAVIVPLLSTVATFVSLEVQVTSLFVAFSGNTVAVNFSVLPIYKVVSCDDVYISCVPQSSAQPILNKVEYESQNKMKTTLDKQQMIREFCIPLQVDRLGNIIKIG